MSPQGREDPETVITDWVEAPATSHLRRFRFINRAFAEDGRPSELHVTFRATRSPRTGKYYGESTYTYESQSHLALRQTYAAMEIDEHPGAVLHRDLIARGNRGRKIA